PGTSGSLVLDVSEADIVKSAVSAATDPATQPPATAMTVPLKTALGQGNAQATGVLPGAALSRPAAGFAGPVPAYVPARGSGSHPGVAQGYAAVPMTSLEAIEREADEVVPLTARRPSREVPAVEAPPSRGPLYFAILGVLLLAGGGGYMVLRGHPGEPQSPPKPAAAALPVDVKPPELKPPEVKPPEVVAAPPEVKPPEPKKPEVVKADSPPGRNKRPKPGARTPPKEPVKQVIVAVHTPEDPKPPPQVEKVASAQASFEIETSPPLQVRVNGKFIGVSPARASNLPPGEVRVEVYDSKLGISKEQAFTLAAGPNGTKRIVVGQGTLEFRVRPFATVFLDGKPLGQTPLPAQQVYEGRHSVRLVNKDLGKEVSSEYVVKAGQANIFKYIFPE
ncbi:MAG: PEGA domain-containing protein, partial [Myxococcaceae bacterium]